MVDVKEAAEHKTADKKRFCNKCCSSDYLNIYYRTNKTSLIDSVLCNTEIYKALLFVQSLFLFTEISVQQAFKGFAVSCFVFCHFMHSIMDSIQILLFCQCSQIFFTLGSAVFCSNAQFQVFFGGMGLLLRPTVLQI